jgi:hypothetical protein
MVTTRNSSRRTVQVARVVLIAGIAGTLTVGVFATSAPRQLPPENILAAQVLLPLLKDLHQRLQPHFFARPGTLPPSPFTGQRTAVVAITVGREKVKVDDNVMRALERLLNWDPLSAPASPEAELFDKWLAELKVKTTAVIAVQAPQTTCDADCVIQRISHLDESFGRSKKQREERRYQLLLDALVAAVK